MNNRSINECDENEKRVYKLKRTKSQLIPDEMLKDYGNFSWEGGFERRDSISKREKEEKARIFHINDS